MPNSDGDFSPGDRVLLNGRRGTVIAPPSYAKVPTLGDTLHTWVRWDDHLKQRPSKYDTLWLYSHATPEGTA